MKTLSTYINEATGSVAISHFNRAQIYHIRNNFDKIEIEFKLNNGSQTPAVTDIKTYIKNGYPYMSYTVNKPYSRIEPVVRFNDQTAVRTNSIDLPGGFDLTIRPCSTNDCELIDVKVSRGKTVLTFAFNYVSDCRWGYPKGTVTVTIPGDLTKMAMDFSKFDCNKYDKFMAKFLPKKVEYHQQINVDEELQWWESEIRDNKLHITVMLQTGKGYSSNWREMLYVFTLNGAYHSCNRMLADRDMDAQIVRKFVAGVYEFTKNDYLKIPETIIIKTQQELE